MECNLDKTRTSASEFFKDYQITIVRRTNAEKFTRVKYYYHNNMNFLNSTRCVLQFNF